MRDDELQILGAEAKQRKKRWWRKAVIGAVLMIAGVIILELSFRWLIFGFGPIDDNGYGDSNGKTIIPELQEVVDSLLNDELTQIDGLQGQVIVMEVQTGRILAMAGLERRFDGKFQPCENFAYQQEMGSTAKTASILAALETGEVRLTDTVDVGNGVWNVGDDVYMKDHNWLRGGYGLLTCERAMEVSSNIGICKAVVKAYGSNAQGFLNKLDSMCYGQPDSIEGIPGLCPTIYSSPKDSGWVNRRLLWHAIGYERKMAPIQMLTFYNAIANNGCMVKPTLALRDSAEVINGQIASKKNIDLMQQTLYNVVFRGLGKKAAVPLIGVAGKTGTSQVGSVYEGDDCVNEYQLAFCGYFPADAPLFSIIVSMNKMGLPASGGGMAGQVFHDIVEWMIAHGMPPVLYVDEETNDTIRVTEKTIDKVKKM